MPKSATWCSSVTDPAAGQRDSSAFAIVRNDNGSVTIVCASQRMVIPFEHVGTLRMMLNARRVLAISAHDEQGQG